MFTVKALPHTGYDVDSLDSLNWKPTKTQLNFIEDNNFTCECCGLISRQHQQYPAGYMEIFKREEKDILLCSMCMQSQHLGRSVNGAANHGLIFFCPTISQGNIINLAQYAFLAKRRNNQFAERANKLISMITQDLVQTASFVIPDFVTGSVPEFVDTYESISPEIRKHEEMVFGSLRYWPSEVVYEKQMEFWEIASFKHITDDLETACEMSMTANALV